MVNIQQKLRGREWKMSWVNGKRVWDADLVAKFSVLNQFALAVVDCSVSSRLCSFPLGLGHQLQSPGLAGGRCL